MLRNLKRTFGYFAIYVVALLPGGCISDGGKVADTDPSGWDISDTVRFGIVNTDTVSLRNIELMFRYDENFEYDLTSVTCRVITPDSLWFEEEVPLTFGRNEKSNTGFYEDVVLYRENVMFGCEGKYLFQLSPAKNGVKGIWGVGIRITALNE